MLLHRQIPWCEKSSGWHFLWSSKTGSIQSICSEYTPSHGKMCTQQVSLSLTHTPRTHTPTYTYPQTGIHLHAHTHRGRNRDMHSCVCSYLYANTGECMNQLPWPCPFLVTEWFYIVEINSFFFSCFQVSWHLICPIEDAKYSFSTC